MFKAVRFFIPIFVASVIFFSLGFYFGHAKQLREISTEYLNAFQVVYQQDNPSPKEVDQLMRMKRAEEMKEIAQSKRYLFNTGISTLVILVNILLTFYVATIARRKSEAIPQ